MRLSRQHVLIGIIIAVAAVLRLIVLLQLPPLKDELILAAEAKNLLWYPLPVHFVGFGFGENVLLAFVSWPLTHLAHIGFITALRAIVFAANLLGLSLLYALARRMFNANIAMLTLAFAAIWPWHILAGSIGFNVFLTLPLFLGAFLLLMDGIERRSSWRLYLAATVLAVSCYAYELALVWSGLVFLLIAIHYAKKIHFSSIVGPLVLFGVLAFPIIFFHTQSHLGIHLTDRFLFFSYPELTTPRLGHIAITRLYHGPALIGHLFLNYVTHFVFIFLSFQPHYYSDYSGIATLMQSFIAHSGISFLWSTAFYYLTPIHGLYFTAIANPWDVLFVSVGIAALLWSKRSFPYRRMLIAWLFLYPIAPSFINADYVGFTVTRDLFGMPLLIMLSAFGATWIYEGVRVGIDRIAAQKRHDDSSKDLRKSDVGSG